MLRRNFFSFLLAPLAFFKKSPDSYEVKGELLTVDEDDMLIRFSGCNFVGNPPLPHKTWLEWSNSPTLYDVNIISNRGERPTLTKNESDDSWVKGEFLTIFPFYVCSKHGKVHTVSFYDQKKLYCTECMIEQFDLLPIARLDNGSKTT